MARRANPYPVDTRSPGAGSTIHVMPIPVAAITSSITVSDSAGVLRAYMFVADIASSVVTPSAAQYDAGEALLLLKKDAAMADAAKQLAGTGWLPSRLYELAAEHSPEAIVAESSTARLRWLPVADAVGTLSPGVYVLVAQAAGAIKDESDALATQWFIVSDLGLTAISCQSFSAVGAAS